VKIIIIPIKMVESMLDFIDSKIVTDKDNIDEHSNVDNVNTNVEAPTTPKSRLPPKGKKIIDTTNQKPIKKMNNIAVAVSRFVYRMY